jgi:hypothetical protein
VTRLFARAAAAVALFFAVVFALWSCAASSSDSEPPRALNGEAPHLRVSCRPQLIVSTPGEVHCTATLRGEVPAHWLCLTAVWMFGDDRPPKIPRVEVTCTEDVPGRKFEARHSYAYEGGFQVRVWLLDARTRRVADGFAAVEVLGGGR